jgi:pimeloyl-ACP methyl ester carboxylesterase/heme-degrading monooxygenase HmoA
VTDRNQISSGPVTTVAVSEPHSLGLSFFQPHQASICPSFSGATFIQLWHIHSAEEQRAWLDAMHRNIHLLQVQLGYRSMSLHPSLDGRNVIVYAQWDSGEALKAAVEQPEVKAARNELDSHGEPEGTIYAIDSVYLSDESSDQVMPIEAGSTHLTFVNIWTVDDRDKQQKLLSAMKEDVAEIVSKPGSLGMAFHSSTDGMRIAVYAQWDSLEAFNHGIANDPAARANRAKLAQLGAPSANTYSVDSVNLALSASQAQASRQKPDDDALNSQCRQRWADRGFTTRTAQLNGVALHVAEAGEGDPVLMLHGYPQSGEAWRFVAPELAKNHRVIIPDLRGMGLSEAAADGYDLSNLAEDMHQLVLSLNLHTIKIAAHDWGAAVGAVYAMRYRNEVTHLAFIESALAGAGFETLWNFSRPNGVFAFIPFLLMGESDAELDTTAALLCGREAIFLRHLWATFTADKTAAPFENWSPYIEAMARPGISVSSSSYYRTAYRSAEQVRVLLEKKLEIPVLAIAGKEGIGANHEALVRAFSCNLVDNILLKGAGHFVAEERPVELAAALESFLAPSVDLH